MITFEGHCPHCYSDRGFLVFGTSVHTIGEYDYSKTPQQEKLILMKKREGNPLVLFSLAGTCLSCNQPVVATCQTSLKRFEEIKSCVGTFEQATARALAVEKIFPAPTPPYSHPSLPENVREAFVALQEMLLEKKPPHFIITGCRTVLEAAARELGGEGKTLHKRIAHLFEQGIITKPLADWADHVRLSGNEAVHEMEGTREEARELVEFSKVFLQFTFELPATIQAARNK